MLIGLIADTHGLLRAEAQVALAGCDHLIHAGDIGKPEILDQLRLIAPLTVVRGNNDRGLPWAEPLADYEQFTLNDTVIFLTHEMADVPDPLPAGTAVVITGHSHKPLAEQRGNVLYINPGSAGPRRFKLPVSVALLTLGPQGAQVHLQRLD